MIVISYAAMEELEARGFQPKIVHVDEKNQIVKLGNDAAEPVPGSDQIRGGLVSAN